MLRRLLVSAAPLLPLAGGVLAACGGNASPTGGVGATPATIEVLTRAGVASPTGHSQYDANVLLAQQP